MITEGATVITEGATDHVAKNVRSLLPWINLVPICPNRPQEGAQDQVAKISHQGALICQKASLNNDLHFEAWEITEGTTGHVAEIAY